MGTRISFSSRFWLWLWLLPSLGDAPSSQQTPHVSGTTRWFPLPAMCRTGMKFSIRLTSGGNEFINQGTTLPHTTRCLPARTSSFKPGTRPDFLNSPEVLLRFP
eukprot:Gb_37092 [translate_table: standard]